MTMSLSSYFRSLGAPLKNYRWSWGAVSPAGDIYLRVWTDELGIIDETLCARLTNHEAYAHGDRRSPGYEERKEHVARIGAGARAFCILCEAIDARSSPRKIKAFSKRLFPGVRVVDFDGDQWLEL